MNRFSSTPVSRSTYSGNRAWTDSVLNGNLPRGKIALFGLFHPLVPLQISPTTTNVDCFIIIFRKLAIYRDGGGLFQGHRIKTRYPPMGIHRKSQKYIHVLNLEYSNFYYIIHPILFIHGFEIIRKKNSFST